MERYPYFINPLLNRLAENPSEEERKRIKMLVAVNIGHKNTLRDILGADSESFANFYPDSLSPNPSTEDTIQTFLEKYNSSLPLAGTSHAPVTPAIDYASMLEQGLEESLPPDGLEETADESALAINAFLSNNPAPSVKARRKSQTDDDTLTDGKAVKNPANPRAENDSPALTESFARIMIKNGNYSKALEIITELNLKNSEKSIYFADQIRFLRKLIINEQKK